ncbi:MAG: hypothetical protein JNM31_15880 [Flavobacteriales bacterium]|nr:hypothetical protein [Flavobacteriales bacterium]
MKQEGPKKKDQPGMRAEDLEVLGPDGKPIDIPVDGSLGLLALGYKGLMAWRAKRIQVAKAASALRKP